MREDEVSSRLDELSEQIAAHQGTMQHQRLEAFRSCLVDVFAGNYRLLHQVLSAPARDLNLAFELIQNVRPPVIKDRYNGDLSRALFNYVASAHTLVDHSRRLARKVDDAVLADWVSQRNQLVRSEVTIPLVSGLRNFCAHRQLPWVGAQVSVPDPKRASETFTCNIRLSIDQLLEWDGWPSAARTHLEASEDDVIDLLPVMERHFEVVFPLNAQLHDLLARRNEPHLDAVNQLRRQYNAAFLGVDLDEVDDAMQRLRER